MMMETKFLSLRELRALIPPFARGSKLEKEILSTAEEREEHTRAALREDLNAAEALLSTNLPGLVTAESAARAELVRAQLACEAAQVKLKAARGRRESFEINQSNRIGLLRARLLRAAVPEIHDFIADMLELDESTRLQAFGAEETARDWRGVVVTRTVTNSDACNARHAAILESIRGAETLSLEHDRSRILATLTEMRERVSSIEVVDVRKRLMHVRKGDAVELRPAPDPAQ